MAVEDDAAIEDLRRAMYRPGAGQEAVARYEAACARRSPGLAPPRSPDGPEASAEVAADPARPARRRWLPPLVAGVAVLAVGVAFAVVRTPAPGPPDTGTALQRPATPTPDVADLVAAGALRTAQQASIRKEVHGGVVRVTGVGPAVVPLRAAEPSDGGGVVTVFVTVDRGGTEVGWALLRRTSVDVRPAHPVLAGSTTSRAGVPATATTVYGGGERPNVVAIRVAAGVRWSAVVVLADRAAPE